MALDPDRKIIQIAVSAAPGNVPVGLEVGELGVDLANPPRMWIGCPGGLDPSGLLPILPASAIAVEVAADPVTSSGGSGLPATNLQSLMEEMYTGPSTQSGPWNFSAAFLRVRTHEQEHFTWESRIITEGDDWAEEPMLTFLHEGQYSPAISVSNFAANTFWAGVGASFANYPSSHATRPQMSSPAVLVYGTGPRPALYVDSDSTGTGLFVEFGRGNGIEVYRHPGAGPHLRMRNKGGASGRHLSINPTVEGVPTLADATIGELAVAGSTHTDTYGEIEADSIFIRGVATENWASQPANDAVPMAAGSRLEVWTTPNGTAVPRKSFVVDQDGSLDVMHNGTLTALETLLGGGGSGTVSNGSLGQIAYYPADGTTVTGSGIKTVNGESILGTGNIAGLPTGGAQYDVLTKNSATAGDAGWVGAGVRPDEDTVIGEEAYTAATAIGWRGNTAVGSYAMSDADGPMMMSSVGIGAYALMNVVGSSNVGIGASALYMLVDGSANVAIGEGALSTSVNGANANTAVGTGALNRLTQGEANTAIGNGAGQGVGTSGNLTISDGSIFIGSGSRASTDNSENEIVIGHNARGKGSNTVTIGSTAMEALYTSAGVVLSRYVGANDTPPAGGAMGSGTINMIGPLYIDGVELTQWLVNQGFQKV